MQSHISQVELGSALVPATIDLALIILLAALAPDGTRMFCGVTGMDWCKDAGLVDSEDIRLCRLSATAEWGSGAVVPFAWGPCPISSMGSDTGIRMDI